MRKRNVAYYHYFFSFFAILTLSSQLSEIPCEEKKQSYLKSHEKEDLFNNFQSLIKENNKFSAIFILVIYFQEINR